MRELSVILVNMIAAGTPILYALLGDMVSQRAGVISLSVEGSMLAVSYTHPSPRDRG